MQCQVASTVPARPKRLLVAQRQSKAELGEFELGKSAVVPTSTTFGQSGGTDCRARLSLSEHSEHYDVRQVLAPHPQLGEFGVGLASKSLVAIGIARSFHNGSEKPGQGCIPGLMASEEQTWP
jgi:hypothetical protein